MDTKTLMDEMKLFLKENKKTILLSTSIILILAVILQITSYFQNTNEEVDVTNKALHTHSFDIYMEQDNLGAYTNSYLLELFLKHEDIVDEIERKSNTVILPALETFRENNEVVTTTELDPINVERNTSTNVLTISFGIGTEEEDSRIAESYFELLSTTDFSFFDDKQIFFLSDPQAIEEEQIITQGKSFNINRAIVLIVLALFGGMILGFIISLTRALLSKKMMYGFTYSWDEKDTYLHFNKDAQMEEVAHSIVQPNLGNKVILSETQLDAKFITALKQLADKKSNLIFCSTIAQVDPSIEINEFSVVVERKKTSKQWYRNQRKLISGFYSPLIKIVQIEKKGEENE